MLEAALLSSLGAALLLEHSSLHEATLLLSSHGFIYAKKDNCAAVCVTDLEPGS